MSYQERIAQEYLHDYDKRYEEVKTRYCAECGHELDDHETEDICNDCEVFYDQHGCFENQLLK